MTPKLIYCDGKNANLAAIAIEHNFLYGIRYPPQVLLPQPLYFIDVDWKKPNRELYIQGILTLRPVMASVIDITDMPMYYEALEWAYAIANTVESIIFIPKIDVIDLLPPYIGDSRVVLGYSVPSSYGKTEVPFDRFARFPIHLLGGSPHVQMRLFVKHPDVVQSVDGNYMTRMANAQGRYWMPGTNDEITNRFWRRDTTKTRAELFSLSCIHIQRAWKNILSDNDWLRDRRSIACIP